MQENYYKTKNVIWVALLLAMSNVFLFIFPLRSVAETTEKLHINNTKIQKVLKNQISSTLSGCTNQGCFKRPNDVVISNDGSFLIVVDSSNHEEEGIYLKKFTYTQKGFIDSIIIPLVQGSHASPLLNIGINNKNNKLYVYREPTEHENTLVQIVDLSTNSVKELKSVTLNSTQIGRPAFLDPDGKLLIAGVINSSSPEAVIIDTEQDIITSHIALPDLVQSVNVSGDFTSTIFTFASKQGQSILIRNTASGASSTVSIDKSFESVSDDFLDRVSFDLSSKRAVLSSIGGNHILHFLDLKSNKLVTSILDKLEGPSISTISPDGRTAVTTGSIIDFPGGFKLYKSSISQDNAITLLNSSIFTDDRILLDISITPDQSKVLVLNLKDGVKKLTILDLKTLSVLTELPLSNDNAQSFLLIEPFGRYAISPNTETESSLSIISDFNLGPVLKKIVPDIGPVGVSVPFSISGFIDPLRFTGDLSVCFKSNKTCASFVSVSRDGTKIIGYTPKFYELGLVDVILGTTSISDKTIKTSKYEGLYLFSNASTIFDTFLPEITILAPKDLSTLKTRRILVLGKADGTGSQIESVNVNGKTTTTTSDGSPNIVSFISDIQFESDGIFEIKVNAKDKSNNINEKSIKIKIDSLAPTVAANIEQISQNQFKVTGTANGNGSNIVSISVNSTPLQFTQSELVNFTATVSTIPVVITVSDSAGNTNEVKFAGTPLSDSIPPVINVLSPQNGQRSKEQNINVTFTVTDNTEVKNVTFNGSTISPVSSSQYSQALSLKTGENLILINATDGNGNTSSAIIRISYVPSEVSSTNKEPVQTTFAAPAGKEVITLPEEVEDLNSTLIDELSFGGGELIDIASTTSIEISNPPPIPEGIRAKITPPETKGLDIIPIAENLPQIPQGFAFAAGVDFSEDPGIVNNEDVSKLKAVVLVDGTGRTFISGFAFFTEAGSILNQRTKHHRFQTSDGQLLELVTAITVPSDASEGDAKLSVLNKNEAIATIPLTVTPSKNVKIGKRVIERPLIKEPINALLTKNGTELVLKIKGANFVSKFVTIDGKLEKLINKADFFTNVTFVPSLGIKIKDFKLIKNKKIILTATIDKNITPGIKLFNVITPKGADIGAIVIPDTLSDGKLEATASPEDILNP